MLRDRVCGWWIMLPMMATSLAYEILIAPAVFDRDPNFRSVYFFIIGGLIVLVTGRRTS